MARQLDGFRVVATLEAILQNLLDGDVVTASATQGGTARPATTLTSGTGANQADRVWADNLRALLSAASENIDLFDLAALDIGAGAGRDAVGQTVSLAEIVGLMVINDADSVGNIVVGGEGSAAAFNSIFNGSDTAELGPIGPGGFAMLFNPPDPAWAVADTSNHLLKIAAAGGDADYSIYLLARSA